LFATEIVPSEQVAAGLTEGETLQVRATPDGLSPFNGVIVMAALADAPGATEDGDSAEDERLKSGAFTGRLTTLEVLLLKLPSPAYAAVMLWVPAVSVEMENVATPLPLRVETPSCVVPSRKLTVPVGEPTVPGVTVAVNVTAWFRFAAVGDELSAVLVFAFCTT
jgi:hypothetical protein